MSLLVIIFATVLYVLAALTLDIFSSYKQLSLIGIIIITASFLINRIIMFNKKQSVQTESYNTNVIDLKDIYENNFEISSNLPILIEEKDVDYDLLNRGKTIDLLYNSILTCNPTQSFVVSLEGKWGSGKTTVINNTKILLKNHDDIIIIDDLDPWSYSTQESLFNSMFERILTHSNIKFNSFAATQMINQVYEEFFSNNKINMLKLLFYNSENFISVKEKINDHLNYTNKKLVFFIDNIDRAEKENVLLLFKLVSNILDFERIIYVLSFDDERVRDILETDLTTDYSYLKKIIQMQIRLPVIDYKNYLHLYETCIANILMKYDEHSQSLSIDYSNLTNFMAKNHTDLRDFKRFINSALNFSYKVMSYLNTRDLLILEYIRLNNISLYNAIHSTPEYFISHDRGIDLMIIDKQKFNTNAKQYFDKLFSDKKNEIYLELLEVIFPYIGKYTKNQDLETDSNIIISDPLYNEIERKMSVCSKKYFDLYFNYSSNEHVAVNKAVNEFIVAINNPDQEIEEVYFFLFTDLLQSYQHQMFMEKFQIHLSDIDSHTCLRLIELMYRNLSILNDGSGFMSLSARKRALIIIWDLLQNIQPEEYSSFIEQLKLDYKNIVNIRFILYLFEQDKENKNVPGRCEIFKENYISTVQSIIENKINIYDDLYYEKGNLWAIYSVYENEEHLVKNYVTEILNDYNIYRFLYDSVGMSTGSGGIRYYVNTEDINKLTTIDNINSILEHRPPLTEDESFILDVYRLTKDHHHDPYSRDGIHVLEYKDLKL